MAADIELRNVEASAPLMRKLSESDPDLNYDQIQTQHGLITVSRQGMDYGSSTRPAIVTYHDIGLNSVSNFQAFFNYMDMRLLLKSFAVFHVNAPGQEEGSAPLPENYVYPTMEQLAYQVEEIVKHYGIKSVIGIGVGLGANVLSRFALKNPTLMDGLFLVNATSTQATWTEWFYQKLNVHYLSGSKTTEGFPQPTLEYLMWHHFGKQTEDRNHDLINSFRNYFNKNVCARNLSLLIESYIKRTDLGLVRNEKTKNFRCPVLLMCSALCPHVDDTVTMNSRLDPVNSTWLKISDCSMVLEENPGKVEEALRLFIQGLGYSLSAYERRRSSLRKGSLSSGGGDTGHSPSNSRKNSIAEENETGDTVNLVFK